MFRNAVAASKSAPETAKKTVEPNQNEKLSLMLIKGASATLGTQQVEFAPSIEETLVQELAAIETEAMGWIPLGTGAYLHQGVAPETDGAIVIQIVGIPDVQMAAMNVVWLV